MLNLFRKIRKSIIGKGKLNRYFFYAIGEMLLVVLGILIALYINNRNQIAQERKVEIKYLQSLKQDLRKDSVSLNNFKYIRNDLIKTIRSLLEMADSGNYDDPESTYNQMVKIGLWYSFKPNENTFRELINSGNFSIISNDSIRTYLMEINAINEDIISQREHMRRDFDQYVYDPWFTSVKFSNIIQQNKIKTPIEWFVLTDNIKKSNFPNSEIEKKLQTLLNNTSYNNGLWLAAGNMGYMVETYDQYLDLINRTLIFIDKEINK